VTYLNEISEVLLATRESSGVSLEEVSKDLEIPILILQQIEEGNMGAFKDIFLLKEYITNYAKYLGLNPEEVMDEFNEHMFEVTSKIKIDEIAKASREKAEEEAKEERVASPYTKPMPTTQDKQLFLSILIIMILVVIAIIWAINQIM